MKKRNILLLLICIALLFTSCSLRTNYDITAKTTETAETTKKDGQIAPTEPTEAKNEEKTVEPVEQSTLPEPTKSNSPEPSENADQITEQEPEEWVDTGLTLEGIKKAAQESGYSVEVIDERQMSNEPKPVDGFNLVYTDEYSYSNIPILEFKDVNDARIYANLVNEKGYQLCIVNGKFLTMTNAQYGINLNDNEMKLLETLLESKVMEYKEPAPVLLIPAKDFAGAYLNREAIYKALDKLVNKSVLLNDKATSMENRISASFVSFTLLPSGDLSFVSNLSEDQVQLDAIVQLWESFGVKDMKLKHETAHDYILTGSRMGVDTAFEIHCSFAPETGALRLIDTDGGEVLEFYEFVPLGGDKFAFQTLYERGIVEYKDGKIVFFVYSLNKRDKALAYNTDSDGIYGKSVEINEAWVSNAGEDNYEQFISYNGTTLKIAADSFIGDRLIIELKPQ